MAEHLNDYQGVVNYLTNMGMTLDVEIQAFVLLSSLHDCWGTLVVSLSNSAINGKLTMDMVKKKTYLMKKLDGENIIFLVKMMQMLLRNSIAEEAKVRAHIVETDLEGDRSLGKI